MWLQFIYSHCKNRSEFFIAKNRFKFNIFLLYNYLWKETIIIGFNSCCFQTDVCKYRISLLKLCFWNQKTFRSFWLTLLIIPNFENEFRLISKWNQSILHKKLLRFAEQLATKWTSKNKPKFIYLVQKLWINEKRSNENCCDIFLYLVLTKNRQRQIYF